MNSTAALISSATQADTSSDYSVSVARTSLSQMKQIGEAAIQLIQAAAVPAQGLQGQGSFVNLYA